MAEGEATVEALIPGETRTAQGRVTMIENTVDPTTGMATVRATMPNDDELLWPGTLVNAHLTLRTEEAIVVPAAAVQVSQQGNFVYVVKDNVAHVTPVKVARSLGTETVIESGLAENDVVVTDGHLLLTDKARVAVRERKPGA
jgi:RND family efflux transporter MFP subunit